jgi:gas vesicle protein
MPSHQNRRYSMSDKKQCQSLVMGTAIFTGIVGTLSALMYFNHADKGEKEKICLGVQKKEIFNKNAILGGVAGGLVAAATALLFAPKAGPELIKDLAHPFLKQGEQEHAPPSPSTSSIPASDSNKTTASSSPEENASKADLKIKKHQANKKRSPVQRRRATSGPGETTGDQQPRVRTRRAKRKLDKINTENDAAETIAAIE